MTTNPLLKLGYTSILRAFAKGNYIYLGVIISSFWWAFYECKSNIITNHTNIMEDYTKYYSNWAPNHIKMGYNSQIRGPGAHHP